MDGTRNRGRPSRRAQITGKNQELPEPQTSISFPEIRYPGPGKEGKEGRAVCVLRDFGILMKTLVITLKSVKLLNKQFLSFSPISVIERCYSLVVGKANLVQGNPGRRGGSIQ